MKNEISDSDERETMTLGRGKLHANTGRDAVGGHAVLPVAVDLIFGIASIKGGNYIKCIK